MQHFPLYLWSEILQLLGALAAEVQWLHIPSHIGIQGKTFADSLANGGHIPETPWPCLCTMEGVQHILLPKYCGFSNIFNNSRVFPGAPHEPLG